MDLSSIQALGEFGIGLFSNVQRGNLYRGQESSFLKQAAINLEIGRFNANVAEQNGVSASYAIAAETKRLLGRQINNMASRGITMEGSPLFVLGDIELMGEQRAQEAVFNSQVQKINAQYSALGAASKARGMAEQAHYAGLGAMVDTAKTVKNGLKLFNSALNSMSGGNNSVIGNILGAII